MLKFFLRGRSVVGWAAPLPTRLSIGAGMIEHVPKDLELRACARLGVDVVSHASCCPRCDSHFIAQVLVALDAASDEHDQFGLSGAQAMVPRILFHSPLM